MRMLILLFGLLIQLSLLGCGGDPDSLLLRRDCPAKAELIGVWLSTSRSYGISDEVITLNLQADGRISMSSSKASSAVEYVARFAPAPCSGRWELAENADAFCRISLHLDRQGDRPGLYCDLSVLEIDRAIVLRYTHGDPDLPEVAVYFSKSGKP